MEIMREKKKHGDNERKKKNMEIMKKKKKHGNNEKKKKTWK